MLRLARRTPQQTLAHLLVSYRGPTETIYADELRDDDTTVLYTRDAPPTTSRPAGRITIDDIGPHVRDDVTVYICGSARFSEAATERAVEAGVAAGAIRIERFGPTG